MKNKALISEEEGGGKKIKKRGSKQPAGASCCFTTKKRLDLDGYWYQCAESVHIYTHNKHRKGGEVHRRPYAYVSHIHETLTKIHTHTHTISAPKVKQGEFFCVVLTTTAVNRQQVIMGSGRSMCGGPAALAGFWAIRAGDRAVG